MSYPFNIKDLLRENIKTAVPYSSARDEFEAFEQPMVYLDANENPFENGVNRYPDPHQKTLKSQLSKLKNVSESQLLIGNGSDEVLDLVLRAFCNPNQDAVITMPPTYGMYKVLAHINALKIEEVPLGSDFQPRIDEVLKTKAKVLFVCSPNNPTGNHFKKEHIETLLKNFCGIVVIDEAYTDFSNEKSWALRLQEFPNMVVSSTLSKAYAMAGLRLGICMASTEIIHVLNTIKPPYNVNVLAQKNALSLLSQARVDKDIAVIRKEKTRFVDFLSQLHFVQKVFPSDANFVLARVDDADARYRQLLQHGIVVRNRSKEPLCHNCLRFTIGTPQEMALVEATLKSLL